MTVYNSTSGCVCGGGGGRALQCTTAPWGGERRGGGGMALSTIPREAVHNKVPGHTTGRHVANFRPENST